MGITCDIPPPAPPPFIPKQGPNEGSLMQVTTLWSSNAKASVKPIVVVVLPSPAVVGVMAETKINFPLF